MRWPQIGGLLALGCTTTVDGRGALPDASALDADARRGDDAAADRGASDGPASDGGCVDPRAIELPREGTRVVGAVLAAFDTRDAPPSAPPFGTTACALRRDRAAVFRYTPDVDGPLRVIGDGVIEVFGDCAAAQAHLGCSREPRVAFWTPPLRAGRAVFVVVTHPDTSAGEASVGLSGQIALQQSAPRARGESCDEVDLEAPWHCGPGLACVDGTCVAPQAAPIRCNRVAQDCPAGLACGSGGRCEAPLPAGARCVTTRPCARDLRCIGDAAGVLRCLAPRGEGERCASLINGEAACAEGLRCDPVRGTCVRGLALGLPCAGPTCAPGECPDRLCPACVERPCVEGAVCLDGLCTRREARPYGACDPRDTGGCPEGYGCVARRCAPAAAGVGAACDLTRGPGCAPGLRCVRERCTTPLRRGSRCEGDGDCPAGTTCESFVCGVPGDEGHACREDLPRCLSGGRCVAGRCWGEGDCAERPDGSPCGTGRSCVLRVCSMDGTARGRCREGADAASRGLCDAGLRCTDGTCEPAPGVGAACSSAGVCAAGASCVRSDGRELTCVADGAPGGLCRVAGAARACDDGAVCDGGRCGRPSLPEGAACPSRGEACAAGLACSDVSGRCARNGQAAQLCRDAAPSCDEGLRCTGTAAAPRCRGRAARGEPCDGEARCAAGLRCGLDGLCAAPGEAGEPCGVRACAAGLACVESACRRVVEEGATCGPFDACAAGLRCEAGRCVVAIVAVPRGGEGQACREVAPVCDPGLRCDDGQCAREVGEGAACGRVGTALTACREDLACVDRVCVARGAAGRPCRESPTPCDAGSVCHYGLCVAGVAPGAECATREAACAPRHHCMYVGASQIELALRCAPDGSRGGRCRFEGGVACDDGLRCAVATRSCQR